MLAATSCKFYNSDLVPPNTRLSSIEAVDASTPAAKRDSAVVGAANDAAASATATGQTCSLGSCWWSGTHEGCRSAGMPTAEQRPAADPEGGDVGEIYLGFTQLRLNAPVDDNMSSTHAPDFGLDLDGACTNSITCTAQQDATSCRSSTRQIPYDGEECRDNTFARVFAIASQIPDIGHNLGLSEDVINCGLWRGSYNMLARITGYNGRPDDSNVRIDWYTSAGLEHPQSWQCPAADFRQTYLPWRASSTWSVSAADLATPLTEPGKLPASRFADPNAYVKQGYLVSRLPEGAMLRFAGDGKPFRGLSLTTHDGLWIGRLYRARDKTWNIQDGLVAGRTRTDEVMTSFRQGGFCPGLGLDTFFSSISTYVQENADVLANGASNPNASCDALSFGIAFEAAQLTPGGVAPVEPLVECCRPGAAPNECGTKCGDGKLNGKERCDTAITAGEPGACPSTCAAARGCERQVLMGEGCDTRCEPMPITTMVPGDGCCPPGADLKTDPDCATRCGNGILEAGETCDPVSSCATCRTDNPCFVGTMQGAADHCTAECKYTEVTQCLGGDRCCPAGCSASSDSDCNGCGDGVVQRDRGETCEPKNSSAQCPARCDSKDPCLTGVMTGSPEHCNVACSYVAITRVVAGDKCCPKGANTNTDPDCAAVCGNSVIEPGEDCDDGNHNSGDSCSAMCKTETPSEMCLKQVNLPAECATCVCTSCASQAIACYSNADPNDAKLCVDTVDCVRRVGCRGADCYCGADLYRCIAGDPTGECRVEVERASKTTSPWTVSARASDLNYPVGRASALGECGWNNCAKPCGFSQ